MGGINYIIVIGDCSLIVILIAVSLEDQFFKIRINFADCLGNMKASNYSLPVYYLIALARTSASCWIKFQIIKSFSMEEFNMM